MLDHRRALGNMKDTIVIYLSTVFRTCIISLKVRQNKIVHNSQS